MSGLSASVQVPTEDAEDLVALARLVGIDHKPTVAHPFDGALLVQILVPLSAATVAVLRTWINARTETRKTMRIVVDGLEITGYSAEEAMGIMSRMVADDGIEENPRNAVGPSERNLGA